MLATTNDFGDPVTETVLRIVARQASVPVEGVTLGATPDDLGLDSLGLVEVIFAIEEAFDITVPFSANDAGPQDFDVSTVGTVVAAVRALVAQKA